LNAYPGEVFEGTVEVVDKQLDATARTVVARIAVKNRADMLKVGLFGNTRVSLPAGPATTARIVVPLAAVTKIGERDIVFVRQPDDDFEVHPVTLGRSAGGKIEILSGLREGEQIATEGVFTLKSAILKSQFGEEE
jgi:multidrug efflux pump subunit AcrA (membrane-fusion protein)